MRTADIGLQTHVQDVANLVETEELRRPLLVGHSYGGMVITGAAAALRSTQHPRVSGLAYVDAMSRSPAKGGELRTRLRLRQLARPQRHCTATRCLRPILPTDSH
ncbi:hypothetical protein GCM10010922_16540 [Microbacterium sorbitolivorans]|uniref:AB hydrolase-1 domain-containing protein n=1 Tax=Microbacterium nanhaiense TaxID=1301026 RepID=A0ABQ2N625_9MICO|nr:hypothetical protein GCM10010922_16540 [Microbacterium sorbitolivorans]GGO67607.1 hypothetical protein GCM10010910_29760 [Microbacterium nanhaiense]